MVDATRHICGISGGKDSSALAVYLRNEVPEMEYFFCDTGAELPETYEYLTRLEVILGKPIVRLNASRGFDHWFEVFRGTLPSPQMRWCTKNMKIKPIEEWIGDALAISYVAIRADESNRKGYVSTKPNIETRFPFGDRLALRDTAKARTKAALLDIGRVATKEEIASVLGLDPGRVSSQLSGIPSVARADKTRWGLAEWIDDEYDGISGEIIQRINEDGGAVSLKRLVEELPRLFGVSEASVRAYADAPQFAMRDGYVSLADESSVTLRSLDDVIDGRDAGGNAYWSFAVEDRYFDGHSLAGLPPELASELGCRPNSAVRVRVDHPAGCRDLSVNWRLTSLTGPSLGYLSGPLRRLGVSGGDRVSLVIKAPGVVEFRRRGETGSADSRRPTSADSLLKRMKKRRAVL